MFLSLWSFSSSRSALVRIVCLAVPDDLWSCLPCVGFGPSSAYRVLFLYRGSRPGGSISKAVGPGLSVIIALLSPPCKSCQLSCLRENTWSFSPSLLVPLYPSGTVTWACFNTSLWDGLPVLTSPLSSRLFLCVCSLVCLASDLGPIILCFTPASCLPFSPATLAPL